MAQDRKWELLRDSGPHRHRHEDGKEVVYSAGEVIHDSRDLDKMWPGKFNELGKPQTERKKKSRLAAAVAARPKSQMQHAVDLEDDDGEEKDTTLAESEFGEDVTADFAYAAKSDLKVFQDAVGNFTICDADELDKAINDSPLTKIKSVEKWVKEYRRGNKDVKPKPKKGKKKDQE